MLILKERKNSLPSKLRVVSQPAILPTCETGNGSNPKTPIARHEQLCNIAAGELLAGRRLPWHDPNAIETKQAKLGPQPQIPVGRLSNGLYGAFEKTVANSPRFVRVLIDV